MRTVPCQIEMIEIIKKEPKRNSGVENTIAEMKKVTTGA